MPTKTPAIPTLNKFRNSLTSGILLTPSKPEPIQLTVSDKGKTSREAEVHIQRLANVANEWRMLAAEADTHKEKAIAHQKTYDAMSAEITAATAYLNSIGAWYNYKGTEAKVKIAEGEMNLAVASVPVQLARQNADFQKLVLQLQTTLLEVNKLRDDLAHIKVMNALNGYNIEIALPAGTGAEVFSEAMKASASTANTTSTAARSQAADMLNRAGQVIGEMDD